MSDDSAVSAGQATPVAPSVDTSGGTQGAVVSPPAPSFRDS